MMFLTYRILALMLAIASLFTVPAAAAEAKINRPAAQEIWSRTELYFGTNRDGGVISDAEFALFMDSKITPRFPDGLTLLTGYGQFLNSKGVLEKERSKLLILLYPVGTIDASRRIQDIREEYKKQYGQESVLRVDSYALVSF